MKFVPSADNFIAIMPRQDSQRCFCHLMGLYMDGRVRLWETFDHHQGKH